MILAITGTPGTGKSTVASRLSEALDYPLIDVNDVAELDEVGTTPDPARDTTTVDIPSLVHSLGERVGEEAVLDGHLSHFYPADLTVVLRCDPDELEERLRSRGWSEEKIQENCEAEVLDVILQEAVAERESVVELDTTGNAPDTTVETVKKIVTKEVSPDRYEPGTIQWDMEAFYGV